MNPRNAVAQLFQDAGLEAGALSRLRLTGADPIFSSSFAVGAAAQASIAAAALAASEVDRLRGAKPQTVGVDMTHAAVECCSYFELDGVAPDLWDKYSGAYLCSDGWVRIHANFAHHRDGALALLGLKAGESTHKDDVSRALKSWRAEDFETAATAKGLVVAALRTRAQWEAHPHFPFIANASLITTKPINAAGSQNPFWTAPRFGAAPLEGLRVLDLTRILAGPVAGRALAAYGADVMLVNSPHLPNIEAIADTSRGKRSVHVDLQTEQGRETLRTLIKSAHVFVQGYRPGGLAALGFSAEDIAKLNPNIVALSLSAYGDDGPWGGKRGFDSLVQTATGLNHDESCAAGLDLSSAAPRAFPYQILDIATGYLIAFAALAALIRQRETTGAIHAKLSLARTGEWVRSLGRVPNGLTATKPSYAPFLYTEPSGFGALTACTHSAIFSRTPARWVRPAMPPGSHRAVW